MNPITFCLSLITTAFLFTPVSTDAMDTDKTMYQKETVLFDFSGSDQVEPWRIINDGVMGGLSQSNIAHLPPDKALFKGRISLENNGGFASTRTQPGPYEQPGQDGILIRIRGDGRKYQFRIKTDNRFDSISYRSEFQTSANKWMTIELPFSSFVPVFRGRILEGVTPLIPSDIQQIGFLIADKIPGDFDLEIDWIKSYQK